MSRPEVSSFEKRVPVADPAASADGKRRTSNIMPYKQSQLGTSFKFEVSSVKRTEPDGRLAWNFELHTSHFKPPQAIVRNKPNFPETVLSRKNQRRKGL